MENDIWYDFEKAGDLENCVRSLKEAIQKVQHNNGLLQEANFHYQTTYNIQPEMESAEKLEENGNYKGAVLKLKSILKNLLQTVDMKREETGLDQLQNRQTFKDIIGINSVKLALHDILGVKTERKLLGISNNDAIGVLLFGPPGNGKRYLAKCISNEFELKLFYVDPSAVLSRWIGESEKFITKLFHDASKFPKSIIFIDEFDSFGGTRSEDDKSLRQLKNQMLIL